MALALRGFFIRWLNRRYEKESPPVRLTQRRIYILPTRAGLLFVSTLGVMLLGSINYNLNLGFILVFLLSGVSIASVLHTYRTLAGLILRPGKAESVFAGDKSSVTILIDNPSKVVRYSVEVALQIMESTPIDVPPNGASTARIDVPTTHRGILRLPRWKISSTYPLGLFRAWGYAHLGTEIVVYPRPEPSGPPAPRISVSDKEGTRGAKGQEDFSGLRRYQVGDSLKHVAWKALARSQIMLSKHFVGGEVQELGLRWQDTGAALGAEARLSRLCRWVLEASSAGFSYSLELPGEKIPLGIGAQHEAHCLTALALYDLPTPRA